MINEDLSNLVHSSYRVHCDTNSFYKLSNEKLVLSSFILVGLGYYQNQNISFFALNQCAKVCLLSIFDYGRHNCELNSTEEIDF